MGIADLSTDELLKMRETPQAPDITALSTEQLMRLKAAPDPTGSFLENAKAGVGKAFTDVARGAGQRLREALTPSGDVLLKAKGITPAKNAADLLNLPTQADVDEAARLDKPLGKTAGGVIGNVVGGAAAYAPLALVPGANSVPMAGVTGGVMGLLKPTQTGESPTANAAIGTGTGTLTALAGNKAADLLANRATNKAAQASADSAQNATRDAALEAGRNAGYVVPPATVKPGLVNEAVESLGGKIATAQTASLKNQKVTDSLARDYLGMGPDAILSKAALADAKNVAAAPYRQIADISPEAKTALESWKQANFDARMQWNYFRKSGNPEAYKAAQAAGDKAEQALDRIETIAGEIYSAPEAGPLAVTALKEARVRLGKIFSVESAMTKGGHVDANMIAKMGERMKFDGALKTIADFAGNFPKAVNTPERIGGLSHALRPSIGAAVGTVLAGPLGAAAGAAAGAAGPWSVRQAMLSGLGQSALATPRYGSTFAKLISDASASPVTQAALPPATVSALLYGKQQ